MTGDCYGPDCWRVRYGSLDEATAASALVEILASVSRHRFHFRGAALRAGNHRLKDHDGFLERV
jgi:hypothetical protein